MIEEPNVLMMLWLNDFTKSRRSSGVEHFLGREGVVSSILTDGSKQGLIEKFRPRFYRHKM